MTRVLRLAAGLWIAVPLMKSLCIAGFALWLVSMPFAPHPAAFLGLLFGAVLSAALPTMLMGLALRQVAATRGFRLRPDGALTLWRAASLFVLVASLILTSTILQAPRSALAFTDLYPRVCAVVALAVVLMFAATGSRLGWIGFTIGIVLPAQIKRLVFGWLGDPALLIGCGALAWLGLLVYLTHARNVKFGWRGRGTADGLQSVQWSWTTRLLPERIGGTTQRTAMNAYLAGSGSLVPFAIMGAASIVWVGVMWLITPRAELTRLLTVVLPSILGVTMATVVYQMMARARRLWLRAGLDRRELFFAVERVGLRALLLTLAAGPVPLFALALYGAGADEVPSLAAVMIVQLLFAVCAAYYLLLLVRGWTGDAIAGAIAFGLLWLGAFILAAQPEPLRTAGSEVLIAVLAALVLWFRWLAPRRWAAALDWQRVRMPEMVTRPRGPGG